MKALAGLLTATAAIQAAALWQPESGFATLPILVPVSLEHERRMRTQPALDIDEVLRRAEHATDPAKIAAIRDTRRRLLDARGRRHALNIRLMDVGVAVTRELTPPQWDRIHMQRDALRARADADTFERVLGKLR